MTRPNPETCWGKRVGTSVQKLQAKVMRSRCLLAGPPRVPWAPGAPWWDRAGRKESWRRSEGSGVPCQLPQYVDVVLVDVVVPTEVVEIRHFRVSVLEHVPHQESHDLRVLGSGRTNILP